MPLRSLFFCHPCSQRRFRALSGAGTTRVFSAASHSGAFSSTNVSGVYAALFDAASGEVLVLQAIPEAATLIFFVLGAALFCHRNRSR